jgi:hypothetical protein
LATQTRFLAKNGLDNNAQVIANIGTSSSISAASAGAGAIRYLSGAIEVSNGTTWTSVGGGGGASIGKIVALAASGQSQNMFF